MKQLLTLPLLVICLKSYCQQMGYRNGLIITQTSDTIFCLVPIASSFGNKIPIKRTADSDPEKLPLNTIKYLVTASNVYENVAFKKTGKEIHKLMWLEVEGKLNLYLELVTNLGSSTSQSGGRLTLYGPPTKTYVIRKEDSTYLIEEKDFINTIKPAIADNKELVRKVETKIYKFDNIEALVKEYNSSL